MDNQLRSLPSSSPGRRRGKKRSQPTVTELLTASFHLFQAGLWQDSHHPHPAKLAEMNIERDIQGFDRVPIADVLKAAIHTLSQSLTSFLCCCSAFLLNSSTSYFLNRQVMKMNQNTPYPTLI